jgi:hypothetical protein
MLFQQLDPVAETNAFLADTVGQVGFLILAVAAGAVALLVLTIGLRMAWGVLVSRGQHVVGGPGYVARPEERVCPGCGHDDCSGCMW